MKLPNNKKIIAVIKIPLCISAWLVLNGAPKIVFRAGYADGPHVLIEGLSALLLLVPFLRDEPLPQDRGRPRYRLVFLILVPMAALRYLASGIFCHAGESFYMGGMDAAMGPGMYKWYVLRTCVTAPLMEELGCRWIAFGKTRRIAGFWPAALLSTAMFSLIHINVDPVLAVSVIPGALLRASSGNAGTPDARSTPPSRT